MPMHGHLHEVAAELVLDAQPARRAQLADDVGAVGLAELAAQRMRNQMQRRLVDRATLDGVERALVGVAVLLEPALQQDDERRFAARRRPEQQQQAAPDLGAGRGRAEIVDDASDRIVDPEQLVLQQRAAERVVVVALALPAHHVPHVLVAAARGLRGIGLDDALEERRERSRPVTRLVLAREADEGVDELRLLFVAAGFRAHALRSLAARPWCGRCP